MGDHHKKSDAENIREILEAVGDRVPRMMKGIMSSIYTPEVGASMGQSVGAYYKELIAAGLPQEAALQMTRDFAFNTKSMMGGMGGGKGRGQRHGGGGHGPEGFSFHFDSDHDDEDDEHADEDEDHDAGQGLS